jgi:ABC-type methionine transport system ATPase subunit
MGLLSRLNQEQATTLIVVTHNHEVARATRRVITLRDGKIQSDVAVRSAFDSDLIDLKHSALGQAILQNGEIPAELREVAASLRRVLEKV